MAGQVDPLLLTVELDLRDVLEGMDAMRRRALELREFWEAVKPIAKADLEQHFEDAEGPDGPWEGRAATTKERRPRLRRKLLGRLKTAWRSVIGEHALVLYPAIFWAGVHDQGGEAGHGARLPARPFAWISDETQDVVRDALGDYIAEAW